LNIYTVLSNKSEERTEDFVDSEIIHYIVKIWNLEPEKIKIILYDDGNCPNVHREISNGNLIIHVGKNFLKLVNKSELIFTLSHEVAHFKGRNYQIFFIFVCLGYIIFTCFIGELVSAIVVTNAIYFVITTFVLYILGLMALHYLSWHEEFSADYYGAEKLKTIQNFEHFFQIKEFVVPDRGLLFDLIFFDHPPSKRRIENILRIKRENR
jgi:Zn-dependent protease with chaperone function